MLARHYSVTGPARPRCIRRMQVMFRHSLFPVQRARSFQYAGPERMWAGGGLQLPASTTIPITSQPSRLLSPQLQRFCSHLPLQRFFFFTPLTPLSIGLSVSYNHSPVFLHFGHFFLSFPFYDKPQFPLSSLIEACPCIWIL